MSDISDRRLPIHRWGHRMSDMSSNQQPFSHIGNTNCQTYLNRRLQFQTLADADVRHVWKSAAFFQILATRNVRHIWINACNFKRWRMQMSDMSVNQQPSSDIGSTKCQTYPNQRLQFQTLADANVRHVWESAAVFQTLATPNLRHIWFQRPFLWRWQHQMSNIVFSNVGNTKWSDISDRLQIQTLEAPDVRHVWNTAAIFRHWQNKMPDISVRRLHIQTLPAPEIRNVWKSITVSQTLATPNVRHIRSKLAISSVGGTGCQTCLKINCRFSDFGNTKHQT